MVIHLTEQKSGQPSELFDTFVYEK